jgi:hypothetical protein
MPEDTTDNKKDETIELLQRKLDFAEFEKKMLATGEGLYARKIVERIVFGVIILFALAALFFIFTKAGLPTPSL